MLKYTHLILLSAFLVLGSCSYQFPEVQETADDFGEIDFTHFYVLGGTFTSGYMDGSLYKQGQQYAFPAMIGEKINEYYDAEVYRQLSIESNTGFNLFESTVDVPAGRYELKFLEKDDELPARIAGNGELPATWTENVNLIRDFSIPGLKVSEVLMHNELSDNPYYNRLPIETGTSLVDLVAEKQTEIIVLSLGFDDLLLPAINGLSGIDLESNNSLLSADRFEHEVKKAIQKLTENSSAQILLLNIPNLVHSPYFSTLSPHFILGREVSHAEVRGFAQFYNEFNDNVFRYNNTENGGVPAGQRRPIIDFDAEGGDRFRSRVIVDETLPAAILNDGTEIPRIRQLTQDEYLLYRAEEPARSSIDFGSVIPIDDSFVLTGSQIEFLEKRIQEFNSILRQIAEEDHHIHIIDAFQAIEDVQEEVYISGGVVFHTRFERYSIYSADGYTLNPAGQAIIANLLIDTMNEIFGTRISRVDVNQYPALVIQNNF